ncbi:MAG: type II secretion system F family protein, partial [Pseudobdellovibrionaceae bacterium]
ILSEGLRPGLLKDASSKVKNLIETGKRLAEAMSAVPNVFDRLYVNMIKAGEEAGVLDVILQRLAAYMEKSEKIKGQVKGAMIYPVLIIAVAFIVITGILVFIIPKFQEFYSSAGTAPPALTQMVVNLSHSLVARWYVYIGVVIAIPIALSQYASTKEGRETLDKILIFFPVIGEVIQKSSLARLSRTLSTLLSSGVGLIEAIEISARTSGNFVIEQALLRCKESVMIGRTFTSPLTKEKAFPAMVVQMISIGEQSGTLDVMLGKIADFYEDEVETAVKAMTSLIEPMLMVFLGGVIAVLVVAMYLPIFSMADTIK